MPVVGDDGNRLAVVPSQHSDNRCAALRLERDSVADAELKHLGVRPHVRNEAKTLHDPVVEIDQFRFGQFVNIDSGHWCTATDDVSMMRRVATLSLDAEPVRCQESRPKL